MIIGVISAFLATVGFSIIFHVPKKQLLMCGLVGSLGWLVYLVGIHLGHSPIVANFAAALVVSQSSLILAKVRKLPVTLLLIPGIIPMVPGAATYQAMYALLTGDYLAALGYSLSAFQVSAAIVGGIVITTMLPRILKKGA